VQAFEFDLGLRFDEGHFVGQVGWFGHAVLSNSNYCAVASASHGPRNKPASSNSRTRRAASTSSATKRTDNTIAAATASCSTSPTYVETLIRRATTAARNI
jgi:hypothetical protein